MPRTRLEANLHTLCAQLREDLTKRVPPPSPYPTGPARKMSEGLFLANSSSRGIFQKICRSDTLLSKSQVASSTGTPVPETCAEAVMGTANFVFFYLGPFRYPSTACGLLFKRSLEAQHQADGSASPFDSGSLHKVMSWPDRSESKLEFHARHELPIPEHRQLLALSLDCSFASPIEYVNYTGPEDTPRSP